jgi:hypothetical protein
VVIYFSADIVCIHCGTQVVARYVNFMCVQVQFKTRKKSVHVVHVVCMCMYQLYTRVHYDVIHVLYLLVPVQCRLHTFCFFFKKNIN